MGMMTAMQSLKDMNMIYLDLVAGLGGFALSHMLHNGVDSFSLNKVQWMPVLAVLGSRLVVDFLYHHMVSKSAKFGGSGMEFLLSSLVWYAVMTFVLMPNKSNKRKMVLYASTVLVMMATARVTRWG